MPDWNDFRYFLALSRGGSLSAAARALGVNQSTVGRRLKTLEDACGARLFDHTPTGFVLTPAAESVHAEIVQLEERFLGVERRLAGADAKPEGVVRLATTETFAGAFLVERVPKLRAAYPHLALELITSNTPVDLARREADLALRIGALPTQPNLMTRRLGEAGFSLFASKRYLARHRRARVRDGLGGHDVIGYGGQLAHAPLGRWLDANAAGATIVLRADSIEVVHRAVTAGLGVGLLPALYAASAKADITCIAGGVLATSPIISVVHEDQARSARVRVVLDFVAGEIQRARSLLTGRRGGVSHVTG